MVYKSYSQSSALWAQKVQYRISNETTKINFHFKILSLNIGEMQCEADVDRTISMLYYM